MAEKFQGAPVYHMDPRKYLRFTDDGTFVNSKPVNSYYGQRLLYEDNKLKTLCFAGWKKRYPGIRAVCMMASHTPAPQKCVNAKNYEIGGPKGRNSGPNLWYWLEFGNGTVSRVQFVHKYETGADCVRNGFAYIMSMNTLLSDLLNYKRNFMDIIRDWVQQRMF